MPAHSLADAQTKLGLVLTGGTIGAERRGETLAVGAQATPAETALLAGAWPGEDAPRVVVAEPLRKLSENLTPRDWPAIAAAARRLVEVDEATGVLVLHGTDTMSYTAAALAYLLADLTAPNVLTGARVPAQQAGSDAAANARAAVLAMRATGPGAYVVFGAGAGHPAHVHLGTRVRKQRAGAHSFVSVNRKLVAKVDGDRVETVLAHAQRARERSAQELDARVLALRLHPGLDLAAAHETVERAGTRAVVVELYASATGPDTGDRFSLPAFIRACAAHDTLVATTIPGAPGPPPPSSPDTYETTAAIGEAGGISLGDMSTEAATVKAMWALAQYEQMRDVAELLLEPIAGELAPRDGAALAPRNRTER
jgi:L-asparaginase